MIQSEAIAISTYPPTFWLVCCMLVPWAFCTLAFVLFLINCGCSIIICVGWCWIVCMFIPALFSFSFRKAAYLKRMILRSAGWFMSCPSSRFTVMKFSIIHWFFHFISKASKFFNVISRRLTNEIILRSAFWDCINFLIVAIKRNSKFVQPNFMQGVGNKKIQTPEI